MQLERFHESNEGIPYRDQYTLLSDDEHNSLEVSVFKMKKN